MIDKAKITELLGDKSKRFDIRVFETLDSTNRYALSLDTVMPWTVIIADRQTSGHGKYDRRFESPEGCGIYMSIAVEPNDIFKQLTALAGVSAAEAVMSAVGVEVGIKWVNDLILRDRKVAGILTEGRFENNQPKSAVVGIGINVFEPLNGFDKSIADVAGALMKGSVVGYVRERIVSELLVKMYSYLGDYDEKALAESYRKKSCIIGKKIEFSNIGQSFSGTVEGIDDRFSLVVRLENGTTRTFSTGEVVKIKNSY